MLTLLLALSAQTASLPASTREAGIICTAAIRNAPGAGDSEFIISGSHILMLAARSEPGPKNLLERTVGLRDEVDKRVATLAASSAASNTALMAECRKRFPKAWVTQGVVLPADPFARRMMCVSATSFMSGLSEEDASPALNKRMTALEARFDGLIADYLEARGIDTTEKIIAGMVEALDDSLELGNMLGVVNACDTAFPA